MIFEYIYLAIKLLQGASDLFSLLLNCTQIIVISTKYYIAPVKQTASVNLDLDHTSIPPKNFLTIAKMVNYDIA